MMHSNLTLDSKLNSTLHDRGRREERDIDKGALLRARRYGMAERGQRLGRIKYTHAGHVFIYDPRQNCAITSWKIRGCSTSGTANATPLLSKKSEDHDTVHAATAHRKIQKQLTSQKNKWTSHTVLVVDMSGSMREDDVNGARCRSDGVWLSLAEYFVKAQLEEMKTSIYDVVSVILMQETASVQILCEPMDWVLYNKLVDLREWDEARPRYARFFCANFADSEKKCCIL
jgi:hypothetical protein